MIRSQIIDRSNTGFLEKFSKSLSILMTSSSYTERSSHINSNQPIVDQRGYNFHYNKH